MSAAIAMRTVPRAADTIDDRLDNWGAALRLRFFPDSAESFEGAYRSPQPWEAPPELPPLPSLIDHEDASEVEGAVCTLTILYHVFLKGHYIGIFLKPAEVVRAAYEAAGERPPRPPMRGPRAAVSRIAAEQSRAAHYDSLLRMGKVLVANALAEPLVMRRLRAVEIAETALKGLLLTSALEGPQ